MTFAARGPSDENVVRAGAAPPPCSRETGRWVLAAAVLGSSMAFIDGTVVNVALPVLQERLSASVSQAQWVVEAYSLFLASLVLVGGSLGDRFGRRRVFLAGVVVFALASLACGFAQSVTQLIVARAVQGIGAALLVPGSLALIGATFSESQRGRAIGTWSGLTSGATAIGPILGGWLVQRMSWRAAFLVNLPIALSLALLVLRKVPESRNARAPAVDLPGSVLATVGLASLVFGCIELPARGVRDPWVALAITLGAAALGLFLIVEHRSRHPMVPPKLMRVRSFAGANLLTVFLYAALSAALFFLPFDLIQGQGYSPAAAGAALLPLIVFLFALSRWSGGLADRIGPRVPLVAGPAIAALGFALLAVPGLGAGYWTSYFPAVVVLGLGMAVTVAPLTTTVMNAAGRGRSGVTSGINNAVARVAGLLAVAVLGIVALAPFDRALDRDLAAKGLSRLASEIPKSERMKLGAAKPPRASSEIERDAAAHAIAAAVVAAFRVIALVSAGLALLASASAGWLIRVSGPKGRVTISDLI